MAAPEAVDINELNSGFTTLQDELAELQGQITVLQKLVETGNIRYVMRDVRDKLFREALAASGDIDDHINALVKQLRQLRRRHIRDDENISNAALYMSRHGMSVDRICGIEQDTSEDDHD
jgi:uncharacterized UPF0160 family protein